MLWDAMKQTWHDKIAGTLALDATALPQGASSLPRF
jgi:hypothetical protein